MPVPLPQQPLSLSNLNELDYLNNHDIELDLSKSQIIWAPNGVGKSSICRALAKQGFEKIDFTEFNDGRKEFVSSAKDELRIGLKVQEIDFLNSKLQSLAIQSDIKSNLASINLSTKAQLKSFIPNYNDIKLNPGHALANFDKDGALTLIEKVPTQEASFLRILITFLRLVS